MSEPNHVLASDRDRKAAAQRLQVAAAEGRLTLEERPQPVAIFLGQLLPFVCVMEMTVETEEM
jgi:hypothetical protein